MANKPVLHRRDHEHGGADTVRIVYESVGEAVPGGGGIMFDTEPQAGDWLTIQTTGAGPSGYGWNLEADGPGGFNLVTDDAVLAVGQTDALATGFGVFSQTGILLKNEVSDGIAITDTGGGGIVIEATGGGDVHIDSGDTVAIGASVQVSISAGLVLIPLTFADPHVYGGLYLSDANYVTMSGG